MLELAFLILAVMFVLLFLFTSADLPLSANLIIRFRPGGFSVALTASLIASLSFPPSLFWPIYLLIIVSFPRYPMFFYLFKRFLPVVFRSPRLVPAYSVMVITRTEESSNSAPLQDDVELGLMHHDGDSSGLNFIYSLFVASVVFSGFYT